MVGIPNPKPRTVEEVFNDFRGRRAGLIKALTTDLRRFYDQCDPFRDNLCLFGLPNGTWVVNTPANNVPPDLPEPTLGINFVRNKIPELRWIYLVAAHSDSWILSLAFVLGAHSKFGKNERDRLFQMINDLPTIFEVVTGKNDEPYVVGEDFLIKCHTCEKLFCKKAKYIKHYRCSSCSSDID